MASRGYRKRLKRNVAGLEYECIYCGQILGLQTMTEEHIWPDALGGNSGPAWFETLFVCETCNSFCGRHVDAELLKTFLMTTELSVSALRFLDTSVIQALPLVYMGRGNLPAGEDTICDNWIGPRGEAIYHFRSRNPPYFDTHAGGDPSKRRKYPGRVYMSLTKPNLYWLGTAIKSVRRHFKDAKVYSLTRIADPRLAALFDRDNEQSLKDRRLIAAADKDQSNRTDMTINVDWGRRLLCKLAVGFGFQLFGYDFLRLETTARLRMAIHENDAEARLALPLRGADLLPSAQDQMAELLKFDGGFVLAFTRHRNTAGITVVTPTGKAASICMIEDACQLTSSRFDEFGDTFLFVVVPSIREVIGPVPLVQYTAHRLGDRKLKGLAPLDTKRRSIAEVEAAVQMYDIPQAA